MQCCLRSWQGMVVEASTETSGSGMHRVILAATPYAFEIKIRRKRFEFGSNQITAPSMQHLPARMMAWVGYIRSIHCVNVVWMCHGPHVSSELDKAW